MQVLLLIEHHKFRPVQRILDKLVLLVTMLVEQAVASYRPLYGGGLYFGEETVVPLEFVPVIKHYYYK